MKNITTEYFANGLVLGILWDGSEASYPLKQFPPSDSDEGLIKNLTDCLESNSETLTGTGDFASELGALVSITIVSTIIIVGRPFTNERAGNWEFVGHLTEEQQEMLMEDWSTG